MRQCQIADCTEYAEATRTVTRDIGKQETIAVCDAHNTAQRVSGQYFVDNGAYRKIAKLGSCPRCGFAGCSCVT